MNLDVLISNLVLGGFLLTAVLTDHRDHRIPNWLTGSMLLVGLGLQFLTAGLSGLAYGLIGVAVGFAVFLFPYMKKAMAAGDVKLMMAVGAFVGAKATLQAAVISVFAGASIGLVLLAWRQYQRQASATIDSMLTMQFPYASAIAIGTAAALMLKEFQWMP